MASLRNRTFFSILELNQAIKESLEELNNREMKSFRKSRKQLFETLDRPNLKALPSQPYDFAEWRRAKLNIDYHVRYDDNHYSAPYRYFQQQVEIRATEKVIEIFHKHVRVASHLRSYEKNKFVTSKDHMPANHQFMVEWNPDRFIRWAEKTGPQCVQAIKKVLEQREYPQQSFRKCLGILSLAKRYGADRLELACQRALRFHILSYRQIKNILEKGMEKLEAQTLHSPEPQPAIFHKNIRGSDYYKYKENN